MPAKPKSRASKGTPAGGQFAAAVHSEPEVSLAEMAAPLPYPRGAKAMVSGQFGVIDKEPDHSGRMSVLLDDGWTVHINAREVVNMDHYEAVTAGKKYDPRPGGDSRSE